MKRLLSLFIASICSFSAYSKTINIVAATNKPPYVYQKDGKAVGFEIELVEQLLQQMGVTPVFHLTPYGRSMKMLNSSDVDAVMTASASVFKDKTILSKPYVNYQNLVVSLSSSNIELSDVSQLQNHTMAAFQTASKVLGQEFANSVRLSPYYIEIPEQKRHVLMLRQKKVETLVMDVNIFRYFKTNDYPEVAFSRLFPVSVYGMAFKDPKLVARFNEVWLKHKSSEAYQQLKEKYKVTQVF